jgi:L,D-peptidoglycan transpeptidase YkuD (ErfK/YbiS/YcfS/YnhG family)
MHVRLSGDKPSNLWEKKQQMRLFDPSHSLKLFIKHNAYPDIELGAGSAIFFHIWRDGGTQATAGCIAMPEEKLRSMLTWINPYLKPLFVLLPKGVYEEKKAAWELP